MDEQKPTGTNPEKDRWRYRRTRHDSNAFCSNMRIGIDNNVIDGYKIIKIFFECKYRVI